MKRIFFGLVLLAGASPVAYGAVDPNVATPEIQAVVGKCQLVASTEKTDPNPNAGVCVSSTQAYLDTLKAGNLAPDALDQQIANLVVALVPLAQAEPTCDAFDDEVARAILLASDYSQTAEQKAQLKTISDTVAKCQFDSTSALPNAIPASPNA